MYGCDGTLDSPAAGYDAAYFLAAAAAAVVALQAVRFPVFLLWNCTRSPTHMRIEGERLVESSVSTEGGNPWRGGTLSQWSAALSTSCACLVVHCLLEKGGTRVLGLSLWSYRALQLAVAGMGAAASFVWAPGVSPRAQWIAVHLVPVSWALAFALVAVNRDPDVVVQVALAFVALAGLLLLLQPYMVLNLDLACNTWCKASICQGGVVPLAVVLAAVVWLAVAWRAPCE